MCTSTCASCKGFNTSGCSCLCVPVSLSCQRVSYNLYQVSIPAIWRWSTRVYRAAVCLARGQGHRDRVVAARAAHPGARAAGLPQAHHHDSATVWLVDGLPRRARGGGSGASAGHGGGANGGGQLGINRLKAGPDTQTAVPIFKS